MPCRLLDISRVCVGDPTVIQPVSVVAVVQEFRNSPVETICPYCRRQIATAVTFETGTFTWVVALVTFLIGYVSIAYLQLWFPKSNLQYFPSSVRLILTLCVVILRLVPWYSIYELDFQVIVPEMKEC